ncbi:MAG: tRNA (adenosine(37)-N6)-threonylcarbamoyltransferase complex transferase subunit TsaD [Clostridiales bacterium]|nr:tRNA (adenosine(37)-N6)-threonylcarbamoyltransferase complex transferase subunit TsaD [Clostridiales bacterium]
MIILSIETSCDETAASVVENGTHVLSNVINSQIKIHEKFGGVVPEIASRNHIKNISFVVDKALSDSKKTFENIDVFAVTKEPGLNGSLLVGIMTAEAYALALNKPLIYVNHIMGHICANFIQKPDLKPPFVCLIASGGHSHIALVKNYVEFEIIAKTRDDAAGEAFDKISRFLGLGYPGGPAIEKISNENDEEYIKFPKVKFKNSLDFSFSGVKTSVINYVERKKINETLINVKNIAASFQEAIVDILTENLIKAVIQKNIKNVTICGGVASNQALRNLVQKKCMEKNLKFCCPEPILCTDNAAMIGCAAYYQILYKKK